MVKTSDALKNAETSSDSDLTIWGKDKSRTSFDSHYSVCPREVIGKSEEPFTSILLPITLIHVIFLSRGKSQWLNRHICRYILSIGGGYQPKINTRDISWMSLSEFFVENLTITWINLDLIYFQNLRFVYMHNHITERFKYVYRTDIFPIGCFLDVERISKDLLIRGKFFDSTILVALSLYVSKTSERGPCAR